MTPVGVPKETLGDWPRSGSKAPSPGAPRRSASPSPLEIPHPWCHRDPRPLPVPSIPQGAASPCSGTPFHLRGVWGEFGGGGSGVLLAAPRPPPFPVPVPPCRRVAAPRCLRLTRQQPDTAPAASTGLRYRPWRRQRQQLGRWSTGAAAPPPATARPPRTCRHLPPPPGTAPGIAPGTGIAPRATPGNSPRHRPGNLHRERNPWERHGASHTGTGSGW